MTPDTVNVSMFGSSTSVLFRFIDPDSGKSYNAKVAFQVLIRPRSYQVGMETVGATQQGTTIDPLIPNNEIEWATREKVATILYGLLVELREEA